MKPQPQSPQELRALGVAQRKTCPRVKLAEWKPTLRKHHPLDLLKESVKGRLPALVAVKNQRMAASAFGFFRGAVPIMAYDLSLMPNSGIFTQLCGDAHVQNLGAFCGLDGRVIFDINDFDESIRGPFDWDVRRMATSILLAAREAKIKQSPALNAVELFVESYRGLLQRFSRMPILDVARYQVHRLGAIAPVSKILMKAEHQTPLISLENLTDDTPKGRVFKSNPPILRPVDGAERRKVLESLKEYSASLLPERRHFLSLFTPVAVGFKVVGTGSVGLRDYCVYLKGNGNKDPLFLQIKEETRSAWAQYLPGSDTPNEHQGQRVADGQRAMQIQSDPLLGWTRIDARDYLVRQLNDHKASVDMTKLKASGLCEYAEVCGEMLARGHARSGDARILAGYIGRGQRFKLAIAEFATAYAAQSVEDWKQLVEGQNKSD